MRSRSLLHRHKLEEFVSWAQRQGYRSLPRRPAAIYEVARLEKEGDKRHIVIYERLKGDHCTVTGEGLKLVEQWLKERNHRG